MSEIIHIPAEIVNARAAANSALGLLNQALLYIDDARQRCIEADDVDGLMLGLENIQKFNAQLKVILSSLESDIERLTPVGWHAVPDGDGFIEHAKSDPKITWDSERLLAAVVRKGLDPEGTGEIPDLPTVVAWRVQDAVFRCAPLTATTGWRVTALREMGLDPDDYRESEERPGKTRWHAAPPPQIAERVIRRTKKESTS